MPEKIGKYLIGERIGRGGMGMIYKAHDPILDRPVALKVISTEVEVTDELRARFFREAQACARLSHPNIVTVYDMGEDDGRLYIVMELLEGEELRRLVAQKKALALEDRLSIMVQVCDGLHYAHQKGIVHRDIKPGNIFVLRNGQVKILDFGIAQIANTEGGLTRTGLIMGTLRYISPEQVRGRADARSDMFSVGAVFYEFLSWRPPFSGDDPMQLLEQLRTEEPTALDQVDPTIPSELAAVVARSMRKEPTERFTDLEQMRMQIEDVQRGLSERAQQLAARVRDQRNQLVKLRVALAERVGPSKGDEEVPMVTERGRLATMQGLERDFSARIEAIQQRIARADALAPALDRASELLRSGQPTEAIEEFEAILAEMPEHARALDGLEQARVEVETQRRRQLAAKLTQDARTALDEGSLTLCLEILKQAAEIPPPAEAVTAITSLREAAEAALAERDRIRRARQEAEAARAQMEPARRAAERQAEPRYAPGPWSEADARATAGAEAFAREAYDEARASFLAAAEAYGRFEEVAREAQRREREAMESARVDMTRARETASAQADPRYAPALWSEAEGRAAAASAAMARGAVGEARESFAAAADAYRRFEDAAREAQRREREAAEHARTQAAQARGRAQAEGAPQYATALWDEAEARSSAAEASFARGALGEAGPAFEAVLAAYRQAAETARVAREQARAAARQARDQMMQARRAAETEAAVEYASARWTEAESRSADADAVWGRDAYEAARQAFVAAIEAYQQAETAAREARLRAEQAAAQARDAARQGRERAEAAGAPRYAAELWRNGETKRAEAQAALDEKSLGRAADAFSEARDLYARSAEAAVAARESARQSALNAREMAAQTARQALDVEAPRHAAAPWDEANATSVEAEAAMTQEEHARAADLYGRAKLLYEKAGHDAGEARRRNQEQAERTRRAMIERREAAVAADAATHAPSEWGEAEASAAAGDTQFERGAHNEAAEVFAQSAAAYQRAEARARDVIRTLEMARAAAEKVREGAVQARQAATDAKAAKYAAELWTTAESTEAEASAAFSRQEYSGARSRYTEARRHFVAAAQAAGIALEAEGRRVDAMMSDARRLLASGDVAGCLRRLSEIQSLRPGDAGAEALRREIERQQRAADEVVEDPTILRPQPPDRLEETIVKLAPPPVERVEPLEEPTRLIQAPPPPVETPSPVEQTVAAEPPTVLFDSPAAPVAPPAPVASETASHRPAPPQPVRATAPLAKTPAPAPASPQPVRATAPVATTPAPPQQIRGTAPVATTQAPQPASPKPTSRMPQAAMAVIGGLAVIGLGTYLLLPRTPSEPPAPSSQVKQEPRVTPPTPPAATAPPAPTPSVTPPPAPAAPPAPAPIPAPAPEVARPPAPDPAKLAAEQLRAQVNTARDQATSARAGEFAAARFKAAGEKARDAEAAATRGEWSSAQQRYQEALAAYGLAQTEATSRADVLAKAETQARAAESRVSEARRAAEQAGAPKLASALWAKAGTAERKADDAVKRQAFDQATTFRGQAEKAYRDAAGAAEQERVALAQRDTRDVEQARATTAKAKQDAEQAAAPRLAPRLYTSAQQKESEAEAAVSRNDTATAKTQFQDAQQGYGQAAQEAVRVAAVQRQLGDAQQARDRMAVARRAAEQTEAPQYASKTFAMAQTKERDAQAALNKSDYGQAVKLFGDALTDYQAAAKDAETERGRQVVAMKTSTDQSRTRMLSRRDEAEKAQAARFAKDVFDVAQAKQTEADTFVTRQNFAAAVQSYHEAEERYREATTRAHRVQEAKVEADGARTRMLSEKQQSSPTASEFASALAEEKQGNTLYEKLSFKEAAERFKAAEALFTKGIVKAPPPVPPPPKAEPQPQPTQPTKRPGRQLPPSF